MTFDTTAPGLCALTPQFPEEAPAAIEYGGSTYVQSAKATARTAPPGKVVASSNGWSIRSGGGGSSLYLLTGDVMFTYRQASC